MKTIEITSETMPWANDAPHAIGSVVETDDEIADTIIANGHAKALPKRRSASTATVAPTEPTTDTASADV